MAVLEKIRVKMGAFITLIIGLALLSFIIDPDTLQSTVSIFSSKYDVGKINGTSISYQDYQKKVDYFTNIYQITSGSTAQNDQVQEVINNSAWQDEISDNLIMPAIESAGVNVGDAELLDLSQGENISPVLSNEAAFKNATGEFDKTKLLQFIQAISQDQSGRLMMYWNFLESNIITDQYVTKYSSLLEKSSILNPIELKRAVAENNTTYDVDFIVQPFGFSQDSTITVSDSEIKTFYEKNKSSFRQTKSNDIEYVVFDVVPSGQDIDLAERDMKKVEEEFVNTDISAVKNFIARNSDVPYNGNYFSMSELESLSSNIAEFAKTAVVGANLPSYRDDNSFVAAKITDIREMPDSVSVQHILLKKSDVALADSLIDVVNKGEDFVALAGTYSLDQNPNAQVPGDLGWMTQQYSIPGFENIFKAKKGEILKINTNYGLHIVKINNLTKPVKKYQVAMLVKEAKAGKATYADYYAKANELVNISNGDVNKFRDSAKSKGYSIIPANRIAPGAKQIGSYKNVRELTRWATDNKVGSVSPIITVDNQYFFVAAKTGEREDGYAALAEVAPQIKNVLIMKKSGEKLAESTKATIQGASTLEQVAEKLGATINSQTGIAFSSQNNQQLDPKFVGAIAAAQDGALVGPVVGDVGVYYFVVKNKEVGTFFTEDDAKQRKSDEAVYMNRALPIIMAGNDKVVDQRYKFM